jgi:hypothetical protein
MPPRWRRSGAVAAAAAALGGLVIAVLVTDSRLAPTALWNAGANDSADFQPRQWLVNQRDDAEMRETVPLPLPGDTRMFREDADHQRNFGGSYVNDNSIGLQVDNLKARTQQLYQSWHTLNPEGVLRADANAGWQHPISRKHGAKEAGESSIFFGIQHFKGHGLAVSKRSYEKRGTQMLHQVESPAASLPSSWAPVSSRTQQLSEGPQSSYMDITAPHLKDADGYVDAGAYASELSSSAVKGQNAYVADWKAKNAKAAQQMVKDAAKLYAKWDLVDPYTGRSKPNLVIPDDTAADSRTPRTQPVGRRLKLGDTRLEMLKEVKADDGRRYMLPWWCVVLHPEADGSGKPTGLSDAYGNKYPEGVGWDGGRTPMGASGMRGVDCTLGGTTLVPYDKDWPLWKGPRSPLQAPEAEAVPISGTEAAELEEGAGGGVEAAGEEAAPEESESGDAAADRAKEEMLASEWPALSWRHGVQTDNALNRPGTATAGRNSDGPEYNVMEDDFVYPEYRGSTQMLAEPEESEGEKEAGDLGDEIFELPQGQGDVQVLPGALETTFFPGHYY